MTMWLGVDTGGTFTDFVLFDGTQVRIHKVLSTPHAPEQAILQGIDALGIDPSGLRLIHGSTVATNAVLEGKGVSTAYVTNTGLADVPLIGRQARRELYALQPEVDSTVVDPALCFEVDTRLSASGKLLQPLSEQAVSGLCDQIKVLQPQAVAINLLFSYLDDRQEKRLKAALPQDIFISCSSEVLPEYREYERGMATYLNAYVGPLMQGYLHRLEQGVKGARLVVMQSAGGTISATLAGENAVRLLLSGPAGGLKGAQHVAGQAGHNRLLTFDMGGTSTDVAMIDGDVGLTSEGHIGPYPVAVPMVDMHTIGAGGGSIAQVDAGGLLLVGPASAGADPGPACYGRGGSDATVTDANLVLGRLRPDAFLGGNMHLDVTAARQAVGRIAKSLGVALEQAAEGIIRIANEHMVQALRVISVQRGADPREFTLVSFGGAGGLHVCALAQALGMKSALVPVQAGVLSALGMLVAAPSRELSRTVNVLLSDCRASELESLAGQLRREGEDMMHAELGDEKPETRYSADFRYQGQSFTLNIPWAEMTQMEDAFHRLHQQRYGHRMDIPVELVNLRVSLAGKPPAFRLPLHESISGGESALLGHCRLYGIEQQVAIYRRENLAADTVIQGPALVVEQVSTTLIAPGWLARVDAWGSLLLNTTG